MGYSVTIESGDVCEEVVLLELEKDVRSQRENLLLMDAKSDCESLQNLHHHERSLSIEA